MAESIGVGRLHHVSICVADLAAAKWFYGDVLGLEEVPRPETFTFAGQWFRGNGCEVHTIHVSAAGQQPGDVENIIRPGRDVTFARHVCFQIEDAKTAVSLLAAHHVPLAAGPRNRGDGAVQLYLYDPDGHLIELVAEPQPPSGG